MQVGAASSGSNVSRSHGRWGGYRTTTPLAWVTTALPFLLRGTTKPFYGVVVVVPGVVVVPDSSHVMAVMVLISHWRCDKHCLNCVQQKVVHDA